jgi:ankyrin repeat protein
MESIIRFLLQNGCHANIPDCEGVTPVTIAARECYWDAVNEFFNHDLRIIPEDAEHLKN